MLLDTSKADFLATDSDYAVSIDSEKVSQKLQNDLSILKSLLPLNGLFSDSDSVPGIHYPIKTTNDSQTDRDQDSFVVLAFRGLKTVRLHLKEQRKMNLVRLRIHYINCNEKSLLKMIR